MPMALSHRHINVRLLITNEIQLWTKGKIVFFYRACGLNIQSEILLPELIEISGKRG